MVSGRSGLPARRIPPAAAICTQNGWLCMFPISLPSVPFASAGEIHPDPNNNLPVSLRWHRRVLVAAAGAAAPSTAASDGRTGHDRVEFLTWDQCGAFLPLLQLYIDCQETGQGANTDPSAWVAQVSAGCCTAWSDNSSCPRCCCCQSSCVPDEESAAHEASPDI